VTPAAWRNAAYVWGGVIALAVGYFVVRIPVQLTDCLANLFQVQEQSWLQSVSAGVGAGYMRPMLWTQIKAMYEVADGRYTELFRGIHLVQVLACGLLFVGALRIRDAAGAVAVPFGTALLFGLHTFDGTIREAFPVNSYLSVVIACLAAVNLSFGSHARWRDVLAVAVFVVMLLTVESGVLVWICLVAAWITGARGVSRRALIVCTAILGAYLLSRFLFFRVGTPDLLERPSGFGFQTLEAQQLKARFGSNPLPFYAYNVLAQISTVLFSEPRTGVWVFVRNLMRDEVRIGQWISVVTSAITTLIIARYVIAHAGRWLRREFDDSDRIVLVFAAVLFANAAVSFPYTKDVIVSPAGALYALAAAVALRDLAARLATARAAIVVCASLLVGVAACGAAVRVIGMCYAMRDASFVTRNEWTEVDAWAARNRIETSSPARAALVARLRDDALRHRAPAPAFANPRLSEYFY